MKKILIPLALAPLGLWAIAALPELLEGANSFWTWRRALIIGSGILALWWMSGAMLLSLRVPWLEHRLGGLDRLYRVHKTIGITTGCLVFVHWMLEFLPKILARQGWIEAPRRGARPPEEWWIGLAKDTGEWAGYLLLALVAIALIQRIPYRYFRLVHRAFGLLFVAGAFHGLTLLPATLWTQPIAWCTAVVGVAGIVASLWSQSGRIGSNRRYPARVEHVEIQPDNVVEVICRPLAEWPGHRSGQFLLADFGDKAEGAHPFTIASDWRAQPGTLTLAIKALGDYTEQLVKTLAPGRNVSLEGPYGSFTFDGGAPTAPQVWIAGGIGITPFVARLKELAQSQAGISAVDLFYCTQNEAAFPAELAKLCEVAGVRLHRRATARDGQLSLSDIAPWLGKTSSIWFCGPLAWGKVLRQELSRNGLGDRAFHIEEFEFR